MGTNSKLLLPFLLLVFLLATGPILGEARICESASRRFRGVCVRKHNCEAVCQTEGFPGGKCRGLRRRCMCTRPCLDDVQP